jgi:hypothetical protein
LYHASAPGETDWAIVNGVQDCNVPNQIEAIAAGSRDSNFKGVQLGRQETSIEFDVKHDPTKESYLFLAAAFAAREAVTMLALDKAMETSGARGWTGTYYITGFDKNEGLDNLQVVSVKMEVAADYDDPEPFVVE